MATNFADTFITSQHEERRERLSFEHRFFLMAAVLFPLITFIGFAPSYYLKPLFNSRPISTTLVHMHGVVMSLWVISFSVQSYLASSRRIKLHIMLGSFGVLLAAAVIVIGFMTAVAAGARGGGFPGYDPLAFMIVPLSGLVTFAVVFGAAIYYRKNAASHKRLMLLTAIIFLSPSISRLPLPFIPMLGSWWFYGVPDLVALFCLAADTYRNGKPNKAFLTATLLIVVTHPVQIAISHTDAWLQFASWLTA